MRTARQDQNTRTTHRLSAAWADLRHAQRRLVALQRVTGPTSPIA